MAARPIITDNLLIDVGPDCNPRAEIGDAGVGYTEESATGTALVPFVPKPAAVTTRPAYIFFDYFIMDPSQLWAMVASQEIWVCAAFEVLARTRSPSGHGWSSALRWKDDDGRMHRSSMRIFSAILFEYAVSVRVPDRITIMRWG